MTDDGQFQRALAALQAGNVDDAEKLFKATLRAQPRHVGALNLLGVVLTRLGRFAEAETYLQRALNENARSDATLYNYGMVLKALNRPDEALQRLTEALQINATIAETWNNRGTVFNDLMRFEEAVKDFDKAIAISPHHAEAFCNKGRSFGLLKRHAEALAAYDGALAVRPDFAEAWLGRGNALYELKRHDDALVAFERASAAKPSFFEALVRAGDALCELRRYADALSVFDKGLALRPATAEVILRRGNVLFALERYDDALAAYDQAVAIAPALAVAWLGRGNVFVELRRHGDALPAYDKALALQPDMAEAWLGRGNVFIEIKQYDDALAAYDRAAALKPDLAEAWLGRGNVLNVLRRYDEALAAFDKALALNPDLSQAPGARLYAKLFLCDWANLEPETAQLLASISAGKAASIPFYLLAVPGAPADQLQSARRYLQDQPVYSPGWRGETYSHDRIRVAYLSADFHEHPVAELTAGLFEHHDRSRFETIAISLGPDRDSPMRQRLKRAFEHFVDAAPQTDQEIAEFIRRHEVDIVVDLMGLSGHNRLGVLARRPAPIQVNYLGYSATMGASFIDYILGDRTVIPEQDCRFYSEQVVWLPDSFLVNDDRRAISERTPSRAECGLPENAFVFCCFNNSYKLAPATFGVWMRLLRSVPESVLSLSEANPTAMANLRLAAERSGVAPQRLIFAPRTAEVADHLARQRHADLFLDTLPYNAHTTAADALWAGVPVLTCPGATFAGRVAASLLHAIGLDELITASLADYEALALELARDPSRLAALKDRLARNRTSFPLFDTERSTRKIEAAYTMMWERHQRGGTSRSGELKPIVID